MAPLRIAMLTTFYPPYNFGGDGIGVQRMAAALAKRGCEVTVVNDQDAFFSLSSADPAPGPEIPGVEVIGLRSRFGTASNLLTHQLGRPVVHGQRLHEILAPGAQDIIWFNNVSLVGGPGLLAYGEALKVYEAHEHWLVCPTHVLWRHNREVCTGRECLKCVASYKRPPQLWRYTGLLERELHHVDLFIAKSQFSREKHHEFGFPRPMEVIPYFLPDPEPAPADEAASPHDRPYFLFVGRLEAIKGVQDLIPAFAAYPDADLIVIGGGDYEAELRAQGAGNPRVKFTGRMSPDQLSRYYRHAIALLTPSLCYETFGIILIESFRQGTPVIARDLGPFPEIVGEGGGLLFSNPENLIEAMRRMQHEPGLRKRLARGAEESFRTHWSESAVMEAYVRALRGAALAKGQTEVAEALERL
jgi:glycosyltransferase involved in cell wall biosynthesis